MNQLTHNIMLF